MPFNNLRTGRKSGIGTSGVPLTDRPDAALNGVLVFADDNNASHVWIGASGDFTVDSSDLGDGFPLSSGDSIFVPAKHPADIYVRTNVETNQKLWWILQ